MGTELETIIIINKKKTKKPGSFLLILYQRLKLNDKYSMIIFLLK